MYFDISSYFIHFLALTASLRQPALLPDTNDNTQQCVPREVCPLPRACAEEPCQACTRALDTEEPTRQSRPHAEEPPRHARACAKEPTCQSCPHAEEPPCQAHARFIDAEEDTQEALLLANLTLTSPTTLLLPKSILSRCLLMFVLHLKRPYKRPLLLIRLALTSPMLKNLLASLTVMLTTLLLISLTLTSAWQS